MTFNRGLFKSQKLDWRTPRDRNETEERKDG